MKNHLVQFSMLLSCCAGNLQAQIGSEFETESLTPNTLIASSFINDNEGWLADHGTSPVMNPILNSSLIGAFTKHLMASASYISWEERVV